MYLLEEETALPNTPSNNIYGLLISIFTLTCHILRKIILLGFLFKINNFFLKI